MKTVRIGEIESIPVAGGDLQWRPIRRTLGIEAFGINAYTANGGDLVVEEHDETGAGAGHHEELYVVVTGRATFTVNGESFDAPVGTLVFLDDPKERRGARAMEDGTTVLATHPRPGRSAMRTPKRWSARGSSSIPEMRRCCTTSRATQRGRDVTTKPSTTCARPSTHNRSTSSTPGPIRTWTRSGTIRAFPSNTVSLVLARRSDDPGPSRNASV